MFGSCDKTTTACMDKSVTQVRSRRLRLIACLAITTTGKGSQVWQTDRRTDKRTNRIAVARNYAQCVQCGKKLRLLFMIKNFR